MNNKASYLVRLCHIARPVGSRESKQRDNKFSQTAVLRRWEILLESLGDMEKVRTFVAEIMVDLQQPYKIRHHPNGVFSFTPNLTEGWHTVTHRGLSQRPLSNSSLRCKTINHD